MKRSEYVEELRKCLKDVDPAECEDAIRYCEEYLDEAGEEHEQQAMMDLGKPAKFAAQIKAEAAIRSSEAKKELPAQQGKSAFHNIWIIFLGIFALPIALPLMLAAVLVMLAFMLVVICLMVTGFLVAGVGIVSSVIFFISVVLLPFDGSSIVRAGGAFLLLGIGLLMVVGMYQAFHSVIPWFTNAAAGLYQKAKGGLSNEK